jgi:hypothetical protein
LSYKSGDDPRLVADLRAALKRWHRPTLGDAPLALTLTCVERRLAANPWLTRSNALRQTVRAALAALRERGRGEQADLLERRYLRDQSVHRLQGTYHLGERSIYYRLEEAHIALAHALWLADQGQLELAPASVPPGEQQPARWRARHLPPPTYTHLFGLDEVLARLLDYLHDAGDHWMISLDGMGGLGKTTLAREAAGRLAETGRFADIAWLTVRLESYNSRGRQQPEQPSLTCHQVLDAIASQLGGIDLHPLPLPTARDRLRPFLKAAPYLVVVDNLEMVSDCGAVADLLWELARPSKFLFTGRHRVLADVGPSVLSLDQLAEPDGLSLIRHEGQERGLEDVAEASDDALRPILAVTGGNPLAIRLVVGQLISLPLSHILSALESAQPGTDPFYQYLFGVSWALLSEPAQHLLTRIALLSASGGTWEELSAIGSLSSGELASAIAELTTHSLLQAVGLDEKIYTIHPLTHHFVASKAAQQTRAEEPIAM